MSTTPDEAHLSQDARFEEGRKRERAAVLAWLRERADEEKNKRDRLHPSTDADTKWLDAIVAVKDVASHIEAGDHLDEPASEPASASAGAGEPKRCIAFDGHDGHHVFSSSDHPAARDGAPQCTAREPAEPTGPGDGSGLLTTQRQRTVLRRDVGAGNGDCLVPCDIIRALIEDVEMLAAAGSPKGPPDRPHKLTWNGTEWVAPCGCRYHPDDDNGSHSGAPHVHRCDAHGGSPKGPRIGLVGLGPCMGDVHYFGYGTARDCNCHAWHSLSALQNSNPPGGSPKGPAGDERLPWLRLRDELAKRFEAEANEHSPDEENYAGLHHAVYLLRKTGMVKIAYNAALTAGSAERPKTDERVLTLSPTEHRDLIEALELAEENASETSGYVYEVKRMLTKVREAPRAGSAESLRPDLPEGWVERDGWLERTNKPNRLALKRLGDSVMVDYVVYQIDVPLAVWLRAAGSAERAPTVRREVARAVRVEEDGCDRHETMDPECVDCCPQLQSEPALPGDTRRKTVVEPGGDDT